ncbi:MAG: hypothetical protein J2P36_23905 [Ktedonobacteraceae bacterium]|nr:hypothetical protein [Ktedonobacteraceae bacterium]
MGRGGKTETSRQPPPTELQVACPAHTEFVICDDTIEDFHHALKTGCHIEHRPLRTVSAQWRLLGILTPTALRLLLLREIAKTAPETPAAEVVGAQIVQVVAQLSKQAPEAMSAHLLWRTIARFGGYLNRRCDGPPGWKTLWQGWMYVQAVLEGVHLAGSFAPS